MKTPENIFGPEKVDLSRHAVIEASAGTGKTYTIEKMVLRLLMEGFDIGKILIVTFTEKATGELRERIRQSLVDEIQKSPLWAEPLKSALRNFSDARIFTIHSFCQKVLKEFAFENRSSFEFELASDSDIYTRIIKQMKREWAVNDRLKPLLAAYYEPKHDQLIIDLARKRNDGDKVLPHSEADDEDKRDMFMKQVFRLQEEYNILDFENYTSLQSIMAPQSRYEKIILPFLEFIDTATSYADYIEATDELKRLLLKGCKDFTFRTLKRPKASPPDEDIDKLVPKLESFINDAEQFLEFTKQLRPDPWCSFLTRQAKLLKANVQLYKQSHSLLSFDDMIGNVHEVLKGGFGEDLKKILQEKYSVGLIDEFQDTDLKQWQIFKSIFVENSEETKNKIFIIGDPKQAIYGFRGADINAYLMARSELLHGGANYYNLPVNRRSMPDLTNSLNTLFDAPNWFGDYSNDDWSVNFQSVLTQDDISPQERMKSGPLLHKDLSGDPALSFVEVKQTKSSKVKLGVLKNDLAQSITEKIASLKDRLTFTLKGKHRKLKYSDICILLRSRNDFAVLEEHFRDRKEPIPFSFYKKHGIYQSKEAISFLYVIEALANPGNRSALRKALVTDFFNMKPEQVESFESLSANDPLKSFWYNCQSMVEYKSWGSLFKVLLYDSGLLYRIYRQKNEQSAAAYEQLANDFLKIAVDENLDATGLARRMDQLYREMKGDEALHEKETEADAVKVMTVHSSKGLEFPVVFVFGGFYEWSNSNELQKFFDAEEQVTVFDLQGASKYRLQLERQDEDKRLYYVAATRAVFKLYLPNVPAELLAINRPGVIQRLIAPAIEHCRLAEPISGEKTIRRISGKITKQEQKALKLPEKPVESHRRRKVGIYSFSSLTGYEDESAKTFFNEVKLSTTRDDDINLLNTDDEEGDLLILPRGAQTGELLHTVLEHIDYSEVKKAQVPEDLLRNKLTYECIQHCMDLFPIGEREIIRRGKVIDSYEKALARMVFNTLRTPIPELNNLTFADLNKEDRKHELEFYVPVPGGGSYLNGIIDMLFRVRINGQEVYYVLDWKTTSIFEGYSRLLISNNMQEKNYILQYQLYSYAVLEWFRNFAGPEAVLGGSIYVYLRGMNPDQPDSGLYFDKFEGRESVYKDRINQLVNKAVRGGA